MSRRGNRLLACAFTSAFLLAAAANAGAQTPGAAPVDDNRQVISANPFLLMFGVFNLEYERKHRDARSWGASTSLNEISGFDYGTVGLFYRYYPWGSALDGFYVGGRGGVHRVSDSRDSGIFYGLGVDVGYNWRRGPEKNFTVGIGVGTTRLFGGDLDGATMTEPTFRFVNVGWSF